MIPFFSIIIVNYNYGRFLDQCLKSVINQTERDYELIIIDGGSTDNSIEIFNKYNAYFKYFISEKDDGQSHALNKGLTLSTGKYVFWLNSDDILIHNSLFHAKRFIINNSTYQWFTSNTIFITNNNEIIKFYKGFSHFSSRKKIEYINVGGPTSIVSNSVYKKVGLFNTRLNYTMDSDMWIRISKLGYKSIRINYYMWGFRLHQYSKTSSSHYNNMSIEHLNEILLLKKNHNISTKYFFNFYILIKKIFSLNTFINLLDNFKYKKMNINVFEKKYL